jgi:hypothetical protein
MQDQFSAYTSLAPAVNSWINFAALFWYLLTRAGLTIPSNNQEASKRHSHKQKEKNLSARGSNNH